MTDTTTQLKVLVPGNHLMVDLLGPRDELLRLVESSFPVEIHVRGNEVSFAGPAGDVALAARLVDEAPSAYRDIRAVMRAQRDLTKIVRELRPILVHKGS